MTDSEYPYKAKGRATSLIETLGRVVQRDPEQAVQGLAIPVLDACLEDVKAVLPGGPVVAAVAAVISPDAIAAGDPLRAVDVLLVASSSTPPSGHTR